MAAIDDVVTKLSDELGAAEDEVRRVFAGLDPAEQRRVAANVLSEKTPDSAAGGALAGLRTAKGVATESGGATDDVVGMSDDALNPDNFREKAGLYVAGAPERLGKEGIQTAGKTVRYPAYAIGGGLGVAGAGYGVQQYFETQETKAATQNRAKQRQLLKQLLNNKNLSPEQKQNILENALDRGLFSNVNTQDQPQSVLDKVLPSFDLFGSPIKTLLMVIVFYMLAKALSKSLVNYTASSGTMANAGNGGS